MCDHQNHLTNDFATAQPPARMQNGKSVFLLFFEAGSHYVALAELEVTIVDKVGFSGTQEIQLSAGTKGMYRHIW